MKFKNKLLESEAWKLDVEANYMWIQIASKIREVAKKVLGESRGSTKGSEEKEEMVKEIT